MINQVMLAGRVGKKDIKTLKNGNDMTTVYLATSHRWTDKQGEKQEKTTWHNVNFYAKLADIAGKYAHVGDFIFVRGQINHMPIAEGEKKGTWVYSVTADEIKFLPKSKKDAEEKLVEIIPKSSIYDELNDEIPF